jgi:hypothetical protein
MFADEFLHKFVPWLNEPQNEDDLTPWDKLGLKPNSPKEAVEAYEQFLSDVRVANTDELKP